VKSDERERIKTTELVDVYTLPGLVTLSASCLPYLFALPGGLMNLKACFQNVTDQDTTVSLDPMTEPAAYFKGWAKPGPVPPGALSGVPAVEAGETLDAISGHYRLFQLADGHRFSTDDVLTAWYGTTWCPTARRVLELGSGLGTVGMIAAWRLPGAHFVTIEAQPDSVRLARKSASWNGLTNRYEIREISGMRRGWGPRKRLIWCWGARPIFQPAAGWRANIRKSWPAGLNCAARWRIIAGWRPGIWRPAACLPAFFLSPPPNSRPGSTPGRGRRA
jgi:hypothetical protein